MRNTGRPALSRFPLLLGLGLTLAACGQSGPSRPVLTPDLTLCPTGAAMIMVGDGYLTARCGCAEGDNVTTYAPSSFTCTVPTGTTVQFNFVEAMLYHQILSTGSPSFASSSRSRSRPYEGDFGGPGVLFHAVTLDAAGSYAFTDALYPGLGGQIVVQP